MLILFIISVICLLGGAGAASLNARSPIQTNLWLLFPVGVVLLAMCFGGLVF